jgi:hypothetical protein
MTMNADTDNSTAQPATRRFDALHVSLLVLVAVLLTGIAAVWIVRTYIFPSEFKPVTLTTSEERVLDAKLDRLETWSTGRRGARTGRRTETPTTEDTVPALEPEPYSEAGASREIALSEKELNALLAKNTDLARKLAIDLSDDLVSARLLVPVDEDFPILGGKTLKMKAGVEMAYKGGKPIVILRGVSIMGVPIPNAWLGNVKNIDLVKEFGTEEGFWKSFSAGVDDIQVKEGSLIVKLKE